MDVLAGQRSRCGFASAGGCCLRGGEALRAACGTMPRFQSLRRGAYLFGQGAGCHAVYCVLRGTIALEQVDPSGAVTIPRLAGAGDVLGCADLFDGGEHRSSARVVDDAAVACLPEQQVIEAIDADGAYALRLLRAASAEAHRFALFAQRAVSLPVEARVVLLLDELSAGQRDFVLPVAKKDLAFMAATSPEVLSRTLVKLHRAATIRLAGHRVTLLSREPQAA